MSRASLRRESPSRPDPVVHRPRWLELSTDGPTASACLRALPITLGGMWLGGDPEGIRRSAVRLRTLAENATAQCATAQRELDALVWVSVAADTFRAQAVEDFALYARVAANLLDAATALEDLARTLTERQRMVQAIADQIGHSLESIYHGALAVGDDVLSYASNLADDVMGGIGDGVAGGFSATKHWVGGLVGAAR